MDYESLLDELRGQKLSPDRTEEYIRTVTRDLAEGPDETAERAALAAYYSSRLPEAVDVAELDTRLTDPYAEPRPRLRGRLHWIRLQDLAETSEDDEEAARTVLEYAERALRTESDLYIRQRIFAFLNGWNQRSRIYPFLGSTPISSFRKEEDSSLLDQLIKGARSAAEQSARKGVVVIRSARRAFAEWRDGRLAWEEALGALTAAAPLLEDLPEALTLLKYRLIPAEGDPRARPGLRALVGLYGAWILAVERESPPPSWSEMDELLSRCSRFDPWAGLVCLRIRAVLDGDSRRRGGEGLGDVDREMAEFLARVPTAPYDGYACEQGAGEFLKAALIRRIEDGLARHPESLVHHLAEALSSPSIYRVEAAASVLRVLACRRVDVGPAVQALADALLRYPEDTGGLSAGGDVSSETCEIHRGCDSPMAYDSVDAPPAESETGFFNLDGLTGLLALCMPASASHRLALGLRDALRSGTLDETGARTARSALEAAARAGNTAAKGWEGA